jgi:hypothetical protein
MSKTGSLLLALTLAQAGGEQRYLDPAGRFEFSYPEDFGQPARGTNDGFADRVAAIRFAAFSAALGGEAVLTRGRPLIDLQAAGGLHDAIALEVFPESMRRLILEAVPPLTAETFCREIARPDHLDPAHPALARLTVEQRRVIAQADRIRHVDPTVLRCDRSSDTITFHKEAAFQPGAPRRHVYGAVRFLDRPYSTFQIVRAGALPSPTLLSQMTAVVRSWRAF